MGVSSEGFNLEINVFVMHLKVSFYREINIYEFNVNMSSRASHSIALKSTTFARKHQSEL